MSKAVWERVLAVPQIFDSLILKGYTLRPYKKVTAMSLQITE